MQLTPVLFEILPILFLKVIFSCLLNCVYVLCLFSYHPKDKERPPPALSIWIWAVTKIQMTCNFALLKRLASWEWQKKSVTTISSAEKGAVGAACIFMIKPRLCISLILPFTKAMLSGGAKAASKLMVLSSESDFYSGPVDFFFFSERQNSGQAIQVSGQMNQY